LARLSPHFDAVWGVDVDSAMRHYATSRCADLPNVTVTEDSWTDLADAFDLVTMIAVLHHLDAAAALRKVARLLAPSGRFLAVGLAPPLSLSDHAWDLASMVTNPMIGYVKFPWPSSLTVEPPRPGPRPNRPVRGATRDCPGGDARSGYAAPDRLPAHDRLDQAVLIGSARLKNRIGA
jgi:SAM-dependent methyltransferase